MQYMYYYYDYGSLRTYFWVVLIISIIQACIFGAITQSINENKGRDGGFAWGFLLGAIGIIVVACRPAIHYTPTESIIRPDYRTGSSGYRSNAYSNPALGSGSNSWKCSCGRFNANYVSSCVCGQNKHQAISVKTTPGATKPAPNHYIPATPGTLQAAPRTISADEFKNISALKEYKALLDSGVITLAEFEAKKREILNH